MKRFIGLILTLSILISCCITSSAVSVADNNNMSQVKIASREEIFGRGASRAAAMPSSESDKLEYVETVFEYMGFDKKFIGLLSDDLIDEMLKAEEFGFSTNAVNSAPQRASSQTESGSNTKTEGDLYQAILWFYYNNIYTVIGGYNWLKSPVMKLTDVISIDINGSFINDSPGAVLQYTTKNGVEKEYTYNYNSEEYIGEGTSCIFKIDLPWNAEQGSIMALVSYQVSNNNRYNTVYAQYFHYYLPTPIAFSVSFYLGISIESTGVTEYKLQCGTAQEG